MLAPAYRLLGTTIPSAEKTHPQAIIEAIVENKIHIVGFGDTLTADIEVVNIQPKQVIFDKAGQEIILRLEKLRWLNTK